MYFIQSIIHREQIMCVFALNKIPPSNDWHCTMVLNTLWFRNTVGAFIICDTHINKFKRVTNSECTTLPYRKMCEQVVHLMLVIRVDLLRTHHVSDIHFQPKNIGSQSSNFDSF